MNIQWLATGRRKSSVARVYLRPGKGNVTVNKQNIENYFDRATLRMVLRQPLELVNMTENFDVIINVIVFKIVGYRCRMLFGIVQYQIVIKRDHDGLCLGL